LYNYQSNETKQINSCFTCNKLWHCTVFHQSICFNPSNGTVSNITRLMFTFQPQHVSSSHKLIFLQQRLHSLAGYINYSVIL